MADEPMSITGREIADTTGTIWADGPHTTGRAATAQPTSRGGGASHRPSAPVSQIAPAAAGG